MFNFQNFSLSFVHYSRARTERYIHQQSFLYFRSARNTEFVPRFPAFIVFFFFAGKHEHEHRRRRHLIVRSRYSEIREFSIFPNDAALVFNSKATGKRN